MKYYNTENHIGEWNRTKCFGTSTIQRLYRAVLYDYTCSRAALPPRDTALEYEGSTSYL